MKYLAILFLTTVLVSCSNSYGDMEEAGGVEVYYKEPIKTQQAKSFATMLDTLEYGKNGTVSFQLLKDDSVHINMVTLNQYHTDDSMDYALQALSLIAASEIFKGEDVQLHVTDETFNRKRSLEKVQAIKK